MNPFKVNQNLALNIYALSGYVLALLHLIMFACFYFTMPPLYIVLCVLFSYYYFKYFFFTILPIVFVLELLIRKKIVWRFNEEYNQNKNALTYFWGGILLNITIYLITFGLYLIYQIRL